MISKTFTALFGIAVGLIGSRAIDVALIGGGVATAMSAVGFAGYMTLAGDHEPLINGMEHLAIFAQPSHRGPHVETNNLDMAPLATIPKDTKEKVEGYSLVGGKPGMAWLREGNHIFSVRPGDAPPRLGKIFGIEQRDGRWALIDKDGKAMIVSGLIDAPATGARFEKRMIFGDK